MIAPLGMCQKVRMKNHVFFYYCVDCFFDCTKISLCLIYLNFSITIIKGILTNPNKKGNILEQTFEECWLPLVYFLKFSPLIKNCIYLIVINCYDFENGYYSKVPIPCLSLTKVLQ